MTCFMTFLHKSIHPLIHFYLFHLLRLIPPFCLRLLLFFTSPSPPPQLIGADYGPDHNTDRRPAACDPIPPSPDPGLPSPALAFLGEKRNLGKHSVRLDLGSSACELTALRRHFTLSQKRRRELLLIVSLSNCSVAY